jgi:periplasmic protein TonB
MKRIFDFDVGIEDSESVAVWQPWWKYLLPAPVPVIDPEFRFLTGDIWGDYPRSKWSFLNGIIVCVMLVFMAVTTNVLSMNMIRNVKEKPAREHYTLITPILPYTPPVNAAKKIRAIKESGGGGGNRATLPASKGRLPKPAAEPSVPPMVEPPIEVALVLPASIGEIKLPLQDLKLPFGDPSAIPAPPSDGRGKGGGIGDGQDGGIGPGRGPGANGGRGGGIAGRQFIPTTGTLAPVLISRVSPRYTREAYDAGIEGLVILEVVINADGSVRVVKVVKGLGMGLDQKAAEAAEKWRFKPAEKDGNPIAITGRVELYFRK